MVKRWFAELTGEASRRKRYGSVSELIETIGPLPVVWRALVNEIFKEVERARQRLKKDETGSTVRRGQKSDARTV